MKKQMILWTCMLLLGYFRLTAFGDAEKTKVAAQRIKAAIKAL